jgi:hypothetical protein
MGRLLAVAVASTALALNSGGCARLEFYKAGSEPAGKGLHFYSPAPYLLVAPGEKGLTASIVYLPDTSKEYVVRSEPGLGSLEYSLELNEGWQLTKVGETQDPKVAESLTALTGLISALKPGVGAAAVTPPPATGPRFKPGLYRLTPDGAGGWALPAEALVP